MLLYGKENYVRYLQSDAWKKIRAIRLKIDRNKCAVCGRPFDLQVHHLTYEHIFMEDPFTDLVTLCKQHHEHLESMRDSPLFEIANDRVRIRQEYNNRAYTKRLAHQFCIEHANEDRSRGGSKDYCKTDVVQAELFPYLARHHSPERHGTSIVTEYFRNRRYEIILDMMRRGYPQFEIYKRTLFNRNMISKVFKDPEQAERLLEKEKNNYADA